MIVTYNGGAFATYNSTGVVQTFTDLEPGVYVFSQVLDRFVLGEFNSFSNIRASIINQKGFSSRNFLNEQARLFKDGSLYELPFTSVNTWLYYSGTLHNDNTKKEIVN